MPNCLEILSQNKKLKTHYFQPINLNLPIIVIIKNKKIKKELVNKMAKFTNKPSNKIKKLSYSASIYNFAMNFKIIKIVKISASCKNSRVLTLHKLFKHSSICTSLIWRITKNRRETPTKSTTQVHSKSESKICRILIQNKPTNPVET